MKSYEMTLGNVNVKVRKGEEHFWEAIKASSLTIWEEVVATIEEEPRAEYVLSMAQRTELVKPLNFSTEQEEILVQQDEENYRLLHIKIGNCKFDFEIERILKLSPTIDDDGYTIYTQVWLVG